MSILMPVFWGSGSDGSYGGCKSLLIVMTHAAGDVGGMACFDG